MAAQADSVGVLEDPHLVPRLAQGGLLGIGQPDEAETTVIVTHLDDRLVQRDTRSSRRRLIRHESELEEWE